MHVRYPMGLSTSNSRHLYRALKGTLVLALAATLVFVGQPASSAQSDFDPPVASEGSATPSSIDVSAGPATVTVRARLTDATGVQGGYFYSNSPSYGTNYQRQQQNATRISGTPQDGIWEATFTYDNTWEPGTWSVDLSIADTNGNQANPRGIAYITVRTEASTAPAAPTQVSAIVGDKSAVVSWSKPGTNGAPINGYTVTVTPGGISKAVSADATTTTITDLTNGTAYTFTVTATNAAGTSPASTASNPVTPQSGAVSPPGAVTSLKMRPVRRGVVVSWQAPSQLGGADAVTYEYRTAKTKSWTSVEGQSIRLRGVKGKRVVVFVRAVNEAGPGRATRVPGRIG